MDLLSCAELLGGRHKAYFESEYSALSVNDWQQLGLDPAELIVIGVTLEDRDAFVLNFARSTEEEREVVWLAGDVVDRWDSFYEFFLSMIEYNRGEARPIE